MCRALLYMGKPILLADMLYYANNSLIRQAYNPKMMKVIQNLAGFGMGAWHGNINSKCSPIIYRSIQVPFYDKNLYSLAKALSVTRMIAHVRGVSYLGVPIVSELNVHPFKFENTNILLAHNGSLFNINEMKYDLYRIMNPKFSQQISGTTDTEWIYALFLSELYKYKTIEDVATLQQAVIDTLAILEKIRREKGIVTASPVNLYITNGTTLIVTRFVFNYGYFPSGISDEHFIYHTLWYTLGEQYTREDGQFKMQSSNKNSSIIIASEPLTEDTTTWMEIPEYTIFTAYSDNDEIKIEISDIDVC